MSFSSSFPTKVTFAHDVKSQSGLTSIYNQKIVKSEHVSRPLASSGGSLGITHSGTKVTTESGASYLIHKGSGYGKSSNTVVVDTKHMSKEWTTNKTNLNPKGTVGDLVKLGGASYNVLNDNCHHASKKTFNYTKK